MELTLGEAADRLYRTRQDRYNKQHEVAKLEEEERLLKDFIINNLPKDTTGAQGHLARVAVVTREVPQIEDWERFCKYVSRTRAWEMLQRRVSPKAVEERWEAGKKVPGIKSFTVVDVSLNKV